MLLFTIDFSIWFGKGKEIQKMCDHVNTVPLADSEMVVPHALSNFVTQSPQTRQKSAAADGFSVQPLTDSS